MDPKGYFSSIGLLDRLVVKRMGHQESKQKLHPLNMAQNSRCNNVWF